MAWYSSLSTMSRAVCELRSARSSPEVMCRKRALGFSARPRAIRLMTAISLLELPGGTLMTRFGHFPSMTRWIASAMT